MSKPLPTGLKLADEIIDLAGQVDAISKSQAIASFSLDGTILSANQNFLDLFGYVIAEIEGRHHSIFVEKAYAESAEYRQFWSILHNGQFQAAEFRRIGKDGREIWLQASYNPILGFDGRPSKVMKFATDVTERKRREALLAAQVDAIAKSQAVIEFALDGTVLAANQNYLTILGYDLDEIIGRHHGLFIDPAYRESASYREFWDSLRGGAYQAAEFKRVGKDGREVWLQATYNPILDLHGIPCKVVKFATDITARKRAENQVTTLEAKFQALRDTPDDAKLRLFESAVAHAKDAVLITEAEPKDLPGPRIVYANPAFTAMSGYSIEDIIGKTPRMFQGPLTGTEAPAKIKAALMAWQPVQVEIFNYHKNGEGFWVELSISPLSDKNGWYTHWISVQRDITARKREQENLRKSENFLARTSALAGIGGWEIELATGELFFSAETYRIYGLEPGVALSVETAISFFAPEARDTLIAAIAACSEAGVPYDMEIPFIRANGERIWTRAIGSAEFADGKPFRISGLFKHIDKQVKERLALQQANDTLNLAKQAGGIGIWTWDLATNEIVCDSTVHHLYGVPESESASFFDSWMTCLHEQDRDRVAQAMQEAAAGKADYQTQFRIIQPGGAQPGGALPGGALRHIRSSGVLSRDPAGKAIRMTGALWDVTREETENLALKEANARTTLATDSNGIGIWEWDIARDTVDWDERTRRLFDIDVAPQDITPELWSRRLHPEDRDATEQALADAVAGDSRFDTRFRTVWRDGSVHHVRSVAEVTRGPAGAALRMLGVNWDVTRETAESHALQAATERMQLAADGGEIGILDYDVATNLLSMDDWVYRIYGTPPGPDFWVVPEVWELRVHPDDRELRKRARDDAIAGIRPYNIEYRIIRDDGALRYVRAAAKVARDAQGRPLRLTGTVQDVTERKELADALAKKARALERMNDQLSIAAHRLTLATNSAGIGVWDWNVERDEMVWDDWMCRLYDAPPDSLGRTVAIWSSRLHPEDRAAAAQATADALAGVADFNTSFRLIWRDGSVRHIRATAFVTRNEAGDAVRMVGVNWDVTAQFAQNLALQEATTRMKLAADSGAIGILEFDLQNQLLFPDQWACRILGLADTHEHAVPAHIFNQLVHPDDRDRRNNARQAAIDGIAPYALDFRIIRADGMTRHLKGAAMITRGADAQALRMTGSIQDITERKETEAALAETARNLAIKAEEFAEVAKELKRSNEELSQFASIASHDLQEPLRMVASYTQLLGKRYKGKLDADADDFITYAVDGAQRMQRLIKDLLTFSRAGNNGIQLRHTASEEALKSALWNLQAAIEESGAVVTHQALPVVLAEASQLTQLFQNLVGNAIKYRGPGEPLIHISAVPVPTGQWQFLVRDNGLGIGAEHFVRIFGMFQRLHGADEYSGTGIGLAICKKIVDRHGGVIGVESTPDAGSTFHFTLAGIEQLEKVDAES
jgi:PAS domain S-box-containing protein